jgi:hypothetical protein
LKTAKPPTDNRYAPGTDPEVLDDGNVQAIFSIHKDVANDRWKTVHRQACDKQSPLEVEMSCDEEAVGANVLTLWSALLPHVQEMLGVDSTVWENAQVVGIEYPIASKNADTVKIKIKNPGAYCTVAVTLPIKWYVLPIETRELLEALNSATVLWLIERIEQAKTARIYEQLSLFPSEARKSGENYALIVPAETLQKIDVATDMAAESLAETIPETIPKTKKVRAMKKSVPPEEELEGDRDELFNAFDAADDDKDLLVA